MLSVYISLFLHTSAWRHQLSQWFSYELRVICDSIYAGHYIVCNCGSSPLLHHSQHTMALICIMEMCLGMSCFVFICLANCIKMKTGGSYEASDANARSKALKMRPDARQHRSLSPWATPTIFVMERILSCTVRYAWKKTVHITCHLYTCHCFLLHLLDDISFHNDFHTS